MLLLDHTPVEVTQFPDGTPLMHIPEKYTNGMIHTTVIPVITWKYDNDAELFQLICLTRKLQDNGYRVALNMPYIPNARMDRVKDQTEVFTLKYFAEVINSLHFEKVVVLDAHSNVSLALLDKVTQLTPDNNIMKVFDIIDGTRNLALFFPDEGSMKRYADIARYYHLPYAFGIKNRDWKTGEIKGLTIAGEVNELHGKDVLIIDDISSKGGTFYHSAKALKIHGVNDIYLYVSHCENTILQGDLIQSGLIKQIFTTDSIFHAANDLITVLY